MDLDVLHHHAGTDVNHVFFFTPRYSFYVSLFFFFRGVEDSYSSVDLSAYHFAPCVVYEAVQVDLMNGDIQRRWFVRC